MSKVQYIPCPFCKSQVEINIDWAIRNGRVFCNGCCKSFDIRVGDEEDEKEEPPPIPETVKEQFDKGVQEILGEDDDDYWDTF